MKKTAYAGLALPFLLVAFYCGQVPTGDGSGSHTGNPAGLTGHLIDGRTKTPADSAVVRLYPVYLNKMAQALGKTASGAPALDSTMTDQNGYYKFDSLDNNIYSVEAEKIDNTDTLTLRIPSFMYIDYKDMGWDTLWLPGSISGRILVPSGESAKNITCYIPGTSYIAITNDTGGFRITGIPAGTYSLSVTSTKFNDTTIYGLKVNPNQETPAGNILLGLDRSKNEHDVWGVFDTTSDYKKVYRIEARVSGDSIPVDSPRVYSLDWRPDVPGYSGFIYLPTGGLFWKIAICVFDSLDKRIGFYQTTISRSVGDIQFPVFNPCNCVPKVNAGNDTMVYYNHQVTLHGSSSQLFDTIVKWEWNIGNNGFKQTSSGDTTIITPDTNISYYPCILRATGNDGNVGVDTVILDVEGKMYLVLIHAASQSFQMGEAGIADTVHTVTFTYDYYMNTTEVTQAAYQVVMGVNPSWFPDDPRRPVENINWHEAVFYCNARSKLEGLDTVYSYTSFSSGGPTPIAGPYDGFDSLIVDFSKNGYRLPTEAEWEYACRAGTTTDFYWGDDTSTATVSLYAWYGNNSGDITHPVATKLPNAWGLYDMAGNVWEWCNDNFADYPSGAQTDPIGPSTPNLGIERGGSWQSNTDGLRSAYRGYGIPGTGFRCVRR